MLHPKLQTLQSEALNIFKDAYSKTGTKPEQDLLWNNITTPFIEKIPGDEHNHLVTFLYRQTTSEILNNYSFYLHCDAVGLPFTEINQFKPIANTDLLYLTLILPSTLRTAYSFLKLDTPIETPVKNECKQELSPYPVFSGHLNEIHMTVMRLHQEKKVAIDLLNPKKIAYVEYSNPDHCFFTESVLELPMAPLQPNYLSDLNLIQHERQQLIEQKRFFQYSVPFSETSLRDLPAYKEIAEDKNQLSHATRQYWIYLPPGYQETDKQRYPLCLFLDGSDYLNTIPVPSILERMIVNQELPPCIAIFFEYSADKRLLEYYGDEAFTDFLATDLLSILKQKHHLPITTDSRLTTIIGLSASGLAAIYAGLTRPDVFGNVITQSAALWSKKRTALKKWVDDYLLKKQDSFFCMEAGCYEIVPAECQFADGYTQAFSILEANMELAGYMNKKGIPASFHEFTGGHNYVCYRDTLSNRIKEVYSRRFDNK